MPPKSITIKRAVCPQTGVQSWPIPNSPVVKIHAVSATLLNLKYRQTALYLGLKRCLCNIRALAVLPEHPHGRSEPSGNSDPEDSFFWSLQALHATDAQTYTQAKYTRTQNMNKGANVFKSLLYA